MKFRALWAAALVCFVSTGLLGACRIVPKNRRQHLADPTMQPDDDPLRDKGHAKIHMAREGAAGGDGEPAGGGCGCSN